MLSKLLQRDGYMMRTEESHFGSVFFFGVLIKCPHQESHYYQHMAGEGSSWAHPGPPSSWDYVWSNQWKRRVISSPSGSECGYGRAYGFTIVSWGFFFLLSLSPRRQLLSFSRDEMCAGVILDAEIHTCFPLAAPAKLQRISNRWMLGCCFFFLEGIWSWCF